MFDITIQKNKGVSVIDSKVLHKGLGVKSYHADWIRRRIFLKLALKMEGLCYYGLNIYLMPYFHFLI